MKQLALILFSLPFLAFSQPEKLPKFKEKKSEIIFLRKVETALRTHNADVMMTYIEPEYKRTQHDEFLAGRTNQFLTELFYLQGCAFNQITQVHLMACRSLSNEGDLFEADFYLACGKHNGTIVVSFIKNLATGVFSIVGPLG